ncbi:MAG: hypothetical protein ABJB02_01900 [Dokdonella sp.]
MGLTLIVLIVIVVACGALFCVRNGTRTPPDFHFTSVELPLGITLLGTLLLGCVPGDLAAWLGHAPIGRMLRRGLNRESESCPAQGVGHA